MARLPRPGSDSGTWGSILNDFLAQVHNADGTLKDGVVKASHLASGSITGASVATGAIAESQLTYAVQTKLNAVAGTPDWNTITNKPAVIAAGADQATARASIGAGTSNLTLGTTNTTAKAGDYVPTKTDVGLGNVDNTSDANKPVSSAVATALSGKANTSHTHTSSQITDLSATGQALTTAVDAASARATIGAGTSDLVIGTTNTTAKAGNYAPTKSDVGLGNVDNTSDANKPLSTAATTALAGKVSTTTTVNGHALSANVSVTANDVLPSQTGNNGKYLTTDGTSSSWATIAAGGGNMNTSTYDPAGINQQVVGTSASQALTNKNLTDGTNTFPTFNQSTTGNAATATKLATPRNINGVAFDGTADITVSASSGPLESDYIVSVSSSTYTATPRAGSSLSQYSGSNFTTVLQSAIDALTVNAPNAGNRGTGGGKIHIRKGQYFFGNAVNIVGWEGITGTTGIPNSQLIIEGEGYDTQLLANTSGQHGFIVKNLCSLVLRDMYGYANSGSKSWLYGDSSGANSEMSIWGGHLVNLLVQSSSTTDAPIHLKNFFDIQGDRISVTSSNDGFVLENDSTSTHYGNSHWSNIRSLASNGIAFKIFSSTQPWMMNLMSFSHLETNGSQTGIYTYGVQDLQFQFLDFEDLTTALFFDGNTSPWPGTASGRQITVIDGYLSVKTGGTFIKARGSAGGNNIHASTTTGGDTSMKLIDDNTTFQPRSEYHLYTDTTSVAAGAVTVTEAKHVVDIIGYDVPISNVDGLHGYTQKSSPASNDEIMIADSADSYRGKRTTVANLLSGSGANGRYVVAGVSTGNTAAQNSTAINNAISSAVSSGLEVIIPGGTYNHEGFTLPATYGITVRGVGYAKTKLINTHATNASITAYGTAGGPYGERSTISDMDLEADSARTNQVGIDVLLNWKLSVTNVNIYNHGIGVKHKASWETLYTQVLLFQCTVGWQFPDPSPYTPSSPVAMVNCSAVECGLGLDVVDGLETTTWHGGDFSACTQGMRILGNSTRSLSFSGINFERITNDDIVIGDGSTGPAGVTFIGCRFFRTSTGTRSIYFQRGDAITVQGSSFTNFTTAIRQDSSSGNMTISSCSDSTITNFFDLDGTISGNGNIITGHPANGISSYGGATPKVKVVTTQATQWAATHTLYGAGKVTVSDSDFTVTPVDGATCLVYNTNDNTIRHAIRDYGSWRVSAAYT